MSISQKKIDFLEERSELVQEVLEKQPSWIISWGSTILLMVITISLILTFIIRYPDVISSRVTLVNSKPPVRLIAKANGPIKFLIEDGQLIKKDQVIGFIENAADYNEIKKLEDSLKLGLASWLIDLKQIYFLSSFTKLGIIQQSTNDFKEALQKHKYQSVNQPLSKEVESLKTQQVNYERHGVMILQKITTTKSQLKLMERDFERDKTLFDQAVISMKDLELKEKDFLNMQTSLENVNLEKSRNDISISDIQTAILKLQNLQLETKSQTEIILENSYKRLLSEIGTWKEKYVITAPETGIVSFFEYWKDNQFVIEGTEIITIIPDLPLSVIGRLESPTYNSGKIKIGQKVNILLNNYPYEEYGVLLGRVKSISSISRKDSYIINVTLTDGLTTTFNKSLEFRQEMTGTAEIITEDISLFYRVFYQFRKIFKITQV